MFNHHLRLLQAFLLIGASWKNKFFFTFNPEHEVEAAAHENKKTHQGGPHFRQKQNAAK